MQGYGFLGLNQIMTSVLSCFKRRMGGWAGTSEAEWRCRSTHARNHATPPIQLPIQVAPSCVWPLCLYPGPGWAGAVLRLAGLPPHQHSNPVTSAVKTSGGLHIRHFLFRRPTFVQVSASHCHGCHCGQRL